MNRKAEGVGNLIAVTRAKVKADLEALGSLGKSLEAIILNESDQMELEEWGRAQDAAQQAREDSIACLRVLGALPPFVPRAGGLGLTGVTKREAQPPRPAAAGERERVASGDGKPPEDAAMAHRARRGPAAGARPARGRQIAEDVSRVHRPPKNRGALVRPSSGAKSGAGLSHGEGLVREPAAGERRRPQELSTGGLP